MQATAVNGRRGRRSPLITRRRLVLGAVVVVAGVVVAACGAGGDSVADRLTIYAGRSETLVGPIIQQFESTGDTAVQVKYAGTAQLAATLLEEGDRSPADIFYAQDPGGLGAVQDLLRPLPARILNLVPSWARSPDGDWVGVSGRARTIVYNTDRVDESDLPDDLFGLTDPAWNGRIGWAPTNASFQTMVTAMRRLWGDDRTREWLAGMKANAPVAYPKNTPIVAAVGAGEVDVGLVNHYYLHRFLAEEGPAFPARNYHPRGGGPGALVMVSGAGVLASTPHPAAAERFIEFLLSTPAQQYFATQTFEYPVIDGIATQPGIVPLTAIRQPAIEPRDLTDLDGTQKLLRELEILP